MVIMGSLKNIISKRTKMPLPIQEKKFFLRLTKILISITVVYVLQFVIQGEAINKLALFMPQQSHLRYVEYVILKL